VTTCREAARLGHWRDKKRVKSKQAAIVFIATPNCGPRLPRFSDAGPLFPWESSNSKPKVEGGARDHLLTLFGFDRWLG
jgi:hypothetical protein